MFVFIVLFNFCLLVNLVIMMIEMYWLWFFLDCLIWWIRLVLNLFFKRWFMRIRFKFFLLICWIVFVIFLVFKMLLNEKFFKYCLRSLWMWRLLLMMSIWMFWNMVWLDGIMGYLIDCGRVWWCYILFIEFLRGRYLFCYI